jgi:hypothetical protein
MKQPRVSRQNLSRLRLGRHGRGAEGEQVQIIKLRYLTTLS